MQSKDVITIILSSAAFCLALISFIMTYRQSIISFNQKTVEDKHSLRKSLTDVVSEITKVNIAFSQLDMDYPNSVEDKIVSFRRSYNSQRRYLANHGEYISNQIPELTNDIDAITIAGAFESFGDFEKAEKFFQLAIDKSPTKVLWMFNHRGLARLAFRRGNASRGRSLYESSLQADLPDTDSIRQFVADTYLLWAKTERDYGFAAESGRVQELARNAAARIGQSKMREDMQGQLDSLFPRQIPEEV